MQFSLITTQASCLLCSFLIAATAESIQSKLPVSVFRSWSRNSFMSSLVCYFFFSSCSFSVMYFFCTHTSQQYLVTLTGRLNGLLSFFSVALCTEQASSWQKWSGKDQLLGGMWCKGSNIVPLSHFPQGGNERGSARGRVEQEMTSSWEFLDTDVFLNLCS